MGARVLIIGIWYNAEKNRAYNERQKREWLAQLDAINGTSVIAGRYPGSCKR